MKKVGVVLSGCGVLDGTEVNEAVLTVYFLEKYGAEILFMAPDIEQTHVVNHINGQIVQNEKRNVLIESARIARGNIKNIKDVSISDVDALVFPGGFGAAKNLTTFAIDGQNCKINEDILKLILNMSEAKKPIAAICIAPVIIAKAFQGTNKKTTLTIGNDENVAQAIRNMGANHVNCSVTDIVIDKTNKIITTPAFMLGEKVLDIAIGIEKTIKTLIELIK